MKKYLSILFLLLGLFSQAQGEANNWYFGQNAAVTFNSGTPVALLDSAMQAYEGCATLSDANGQLLFYTDGMNVYDRTHTIMVNGSGLLGHWDSTQSGTIVPLPGSTTLYYVFTLDRQAQANGYRYSIIDLNLNGGLGAVTTKNVLIYAPSCEKLTVVKHANDQDYWIITHGIANNTFYSHLLTASGLNAPVMSNVGYVTSYGTSYSGAAGAMKISPNGQKLAVCYAAHSIEDNKLELYDFNIVSGHVTNAQTLMSFDSGWIYGVEFSPNGEVLYVSSNNPEKLFQFDLTASNISNSIVSIYEDDGIGYKYYPRALQLGPDGKIYIAMGSDPYLGTINDPNTLGLGSNFVPFQVDLLGRLPYLGLPVFNQSYFAPAIQVENTCLGEVTQFELGNTSVTSAIWDFGDGNTSNQLVPTHTYGAVGTYTVGVTATSTYGTGVTTRDITISAVPTATQPNNLLACDDDNDGFYTFDLTQNTTAILNGQLPTEFGVRFYANATDYTNKTIITTPTSYQNLVAYQAQTIVAEVYNLVNNNCNAITTFDIQVFETPTPLTIVPTIRQCDATSFGTNNDNRIVFDLTQNESVILNGQSVTAFTVNYYTDASYTNLIVNPNNFVNTNAVETIYVQVSNNLNTNCIGTTSFEIEVYANPVINSPVTLKQCDDDNDGFSAFNLTEAENLIIGNTTGLTIAYFESFVDAQNNNNPIPNATAYTNQTVSTDVVYVRVTNANNCYGVAQLNLVVSTTQISNSIQETFTVCDDMASGSNTDGIATFDFSSVNAQILAQYPSGQLLDITYYPNIADALAEQNAIVDISNYTNIGYPNTQDIYVRVDSQLNNDCLGLGHHITLHVESIPIVQPQSYNHCDDDQDGIYTFDTANLESDLLNGLSNVVITYSDALGNPILMTNPFVTSSQVLTARVTNTTSTACFYETTITFTVDDLPEAFVIPISLTTVCDDEVNPSLQDGLYAFDTSSFQSAILGTQTGMLVSYYDENGIALSSPLPNPFITSTQDILVEVINPINTTCAATTTIPFVVLPVPEIELQGDGLVCSDNTTFTLDIDAGLIDPTTQNDYTYQWYLDNSLLPNETNYNLVVNNEGVYSVVVTNATNCSRTRTIAVTASDIATIDDIVVSDLSYNNSILVLVSGEGIYEYSLDNNIYQSSNVFSNLPAGIYTVYVNDIYGCGIATKEISVLGVPKFFTPNGDGYNDTWNIQGVNEQLNAKTIIYIFDR
uniref:PKD domain-containing protein n=1 Tax=Flavobacterium sp. TaxID=239 RepID=UPI00404808ED